MLKKISLLILALLAVCNVVAAEGEEEALDGLNLQRIAHRKKSLLERDEDIRRMHDLVLKNRLQKAEERVEAQLVKERNDFYLQHGNRPEGKAWRDQVPTDKREMSVAARIAAFEDAASV